MLRMVRQRESIRVVTKGIPRFGIAWLLGIVGGGLCGAALELVFGVLEGRFQAVDGFSSPYLYFASFGASYGAILGAFITAIAYPWLIRKTSLQRAFWTGMLGTLFGGFLGMLLPVMVRTLFGASLNMSVELLMASLAIIFFLVALAWAAPKHA